MPNYSKVTSDVIELAEALIAEFHTELSDINIGFVFRDEPTTSGGHTVHAGVKKVGAELRPHLALDVLIWICEMSWENLVGEQKNALIDHQLCHIQYSEMTGISIVGHDIEEFRTILDRYGLWNQNLFSMSETFAKASQGQFAFGIEARQPGGVYAVDPSLLEEE